MDYSINRNKQMKILKEQLMCQIIFNNNNNKFRWGILEHAWPTNVRTTLLVSGPGLLKCISILVNGLPLMLITDINLLKSNNNSP
jgi:hypothetical protein